jgi:GTP-binding protein
MKITSAEFVLGVADPGQLPPGSRPELALAGRSNVGKSSLINRLAGRKALARTSADPGKTRELNFYLLNDAFHLVDLPGYGFARASAGHRAAWGRLVEEYLSHRRQLAGVVLAVDVRRPPTELDDRMAAWLQHHGIAFVVALTKSDKLAHAARAGALAAARAFLGRYTLCRALIPFSAVTGDGKNELWSVIAPLLAGDSR